MYAGRLVETGPLATVIGNPNHPYTRGLLDAVPRPGAPPGTRFRTMPGRSGAGPDDTSGCAFASRCPVALPACVQRQPILVALGGAHRSACLRQPGEPSLTPAAGVGRNGD
ncbi:hypothetical protein O7597_04860 [Verrucosispora sp. WMMC514]|nr:oligopeptide/dipeptide ABC transporter ATP-binding protein [Verrucosispora sp. WMMC514]WBB94394.1 hypothetical protein O7597_04860 [Verrucosispora sp. WMMC514]